MSQSEGFVSVAREFGPLFGVAVFLSLLFGAGAIRNSYKQDNKIAWLIQYFLSSIVTAVLAVATALLLPLLFPEGVSREVQLGITAYVCVFGIKGIDGLVRKRLGFSIININDYRDRERLRERMTDEQRESYTRNCPMKDECTSCTACRLAAYHE